MILLGIAVLCPPQLVSIVQLFLKASSLSSGVLIQPLSSLRIIRFQNFRLHAHAPPLKTPLAPSPACLNHSIIFESLLLQYLMQICRHRIATAKNTNSSAASGTHL